MKHFIVKYAIALLIGAFLSVLLTVPVLEIWPELLEREAEDGTVHTYGLGYLISAIQYIINLVIAFMMFKDMKKHNLISILLLILTILSSLGGVVLFLFILKNQILDNQKLHAHV